MAKNVRQLFSPNWQFPFVWNHLSINRLGWSFPINPILTDKSSAWSVYPVYVLFVPFARHQIRFFFTQHVLKLWKYMYSPVHVTLLFTDNRIESSRRLSATSTNFVPSFDFSSVVNFTFVQIEVNLFSSWLILVEGLSPRKISST